VAGPIGKLTPEKDREVSGVNIIMYTLVDGKLKGINVEADFLDGAMLDPDNNVNNPVYGMKGREVLTGSATRTVSTGASVTAFSDILKEKFPVQILRQ
jgi:hypothetical protein